MSVHQESLDMVRAVERHEEPPALEYSAVRNDSLTMFGAAIGGAVLGMLLTLLVLAIINGGTLSFSGGERLDVLEASVTAINDNVGAVSYNVDILAGQARGLQSQLAAVETSLRSELDNGKQEVVVLQTAVEELGRTSTQFNTFIAALDEALSSIRAEQAPAAPQQ